MNRIIILSLILIAGNSFSTYSQAQVISTELQNFYDDFASRKMMEGPIGEAYDGSPYLTDEFVSGTIFLANGEEYPDILLRYNVYDDLFELKKEDNIFIIDRQKTDYIFNLGDRIFSYNNYILKGRATEGYLEQLVRGTYSLYAKHIVVFREGEKPEPFKEARKPKFHIQNPDLLIGKDDGSIVEIKSAKDLYDKFNDLEKLIEEYTGNKKLKLKTEQDYIELVNFLNSNR